MALLPPDLQQFVLDQLAAGKYHSSADVLCDAVRLLRERELKRAALQCKINQGIQQLESGDCIEIDSDAALREFFAEIERGRQPQRSAFGTDFWDNAEDDEDWNDA